MNKKRPVLIGLLSIMFFGLIPALAQTDEYKHEQQPIIEKSPEEMVCSQNLSVNYDFFSFGTSPTDSMYPNINKTSIAYVTEVTGETDITKDDIIVFKVPDRFGCLWAHRVIKIGIDSKGVYYLTKGDNNILPDFWQKTRREDIYYKVTSIV